ncbi:hypothetical protein [Methylocapsa palsarum]|uniref:hypothetical protein n=1 Tax=Methylocapsa palsarum TaxID=1612308 RepID=UPI001587325E|nr:hypothetical protein [Methylocapsa palsarum]
MINAITEKEQKPPMPRKTPLAAAKVLFDPPSTIIASPLRQGLTMPRIELIFPAA